MVKTPVIYQDVALIHICRRCNARGVMVIAEGNGHGDTSSNTERD